MLVNASADGIPLKTHGCHCGNSLISLDTLLSAIPIAFGLKLSGEPNVLFSKMIELKRKIIIKHINPIANNVRLFKLIFI
ncbi:MAG: hypothetical protein CL736_03240 [Chloroflexi bacterium]|nr:hypothetical protein [Chloroflexota bacterium]